MTEKSISRDKFIKELNKKYGERAIFRMDDRTDITQIRSIPTGSLALDLCTGVGGFPRGRVVEIYGPEATGKSLLSLSAVAMTQQMGGTAAVIDTEYALTPGFARLLGVDTKTLYYVQPDDGQKALQIMEELIASSLFDIVVLDSVAALVTEGELAQNLGESKIAPTAILMAQALKRMTSIIGKTKTVAIFVNQLREKPMVMFGSPEYTPGGRALKFYASMRIDVRKKDVKKDANNRPIGHSVEAYIVKNKVAPPFSRCRIELNYVNGIDPIQDLTETAIIMGIITRSSSWYFYGEQKFNGYDQLHAWLNQDTKNMQPIYKEIRRRMDEQNPTIEEIKE